MGAELKLGKLSARGLLSAMIAMWLVAALSLIVLLLAEPRRDQELRHLQAQTLIAARAIANRQAEALHAVHRDLEQLAGGAGRALFGANCARTLGAVLRSQSHYFQLGVADAEGEVKCTGLPVALPVSVRDRSYFQLAAAGKGPVLGEAILARRSGRWTTVVARSVFDRGNRLRGVVFATLDFGWAEETFRSLRLPQGSFIGMTDSRGTVVARFPESHKYVGRTLTDSARFMRSIGAAGEGFIDGVGQDGVKRAVTHTAVPGTGLYVHVGIPLDSTGVATAERVRRALAIALAALMAAALALCGFRSYRRAGRGDETALPAGSVVPPAAPPASRVPPLSSAVTAVPEPPPETHASRVVRVLLIEDSLPDAELLVAELRRGGLACEHLRVETAAEIAAALRDSTWDIVVSDHTLPGFGGFEALAQVKAHDADLPFIMVSGTIGEDVAVGSMKAGAGDYVMKSNLARLAPAVRRELNDAEGRRERKRAEAALLSSETKYRGLIEQASDGIFATDRDGRFALVNSRYCQMLGYEESELLTMSVVDTYPLDERVAVIAQLARLDQLRSRTFERRMRRKDGTLFPVEVSVSQSDEGLRQGIVRDISARDRAHKVLELEHAVARSLAEAENARAGLQATIRRVCETEGWGCGRYFALDETAGGLRFTEGWCIDDPALRKFIAISAGMVSRAGVGLVGHAWQSGQPLWVPDITRDPRARHGPDTRALGVHGSFLFPATFEARIVGMFVFDSREVREPDERLLKALEVIGGQIGQFVVRKEQQLRIARLSRIHAVLSGINSTIVRVHDREDLFREACRIAVQAGQFRMAWIGIVEGPGIALKPIAAEGDVRGFFDAGPASINDCGGMAWRAMRARKAVISNDVQNDPQMRMKERCLERGINSVVMLPLKTQDGVEGVLALYAGDLGFFDSEEMKLLEELAGDISFALEHIRKSEQLDYLAYYDALTGVANRTLFLDRLGKHLHSASREGNKLVVLFFDVDRFKAINDSLGRQAGDSLLKAMAGRLAGRLRDADDLARVSADHFAVVLRDVQSENDVARVVEALLRAALDEPFELGGEALRVSAKCGIAVYPNDGEDAETLFRNAESAAQKAKDEGEKYVFYTRQMSERIAGKLGLENRLRLALEKDQFALHYQPKVDLCTGHIVGVEALIRWLDPERGLVAPAEFIPLLEETGLILDVGRWALRRAVRDHAGWLRSGIDAPRIAVNVSPIQLRQRDFVDSVAQALAGGAQPPGIDLEITESLIMQNIEANIAKLLAVRSLGVGAAIDDFGTGYSSLSYLTKLPVQVLKIDRSFIVAMMDDADVRTLVSTVIRLAHSLRLVVVAEGVEEQAQADFLREQGCDQMQGYLFSRPVALEQATALIVRNAAGRS
jgi:diguanylate cyclase (GGDEF)-like protein/PAS domain S-box-containing protein